MRVRTDIDVFQRVTLRPWEPIPTNSAFGVLELGEDDKKTIDRDFAGWTTLALAFAIGAALLAGTLMTRRLKRER